MVGQGESCRGGLLRLIVKVGMGGLMVALVEGLRGHPHGSFLPQLPFFCGGVVLSPSTISGVAGSYTCEVPCLLDPWGGKEN